jgi:cytochrome b6-f complex iron-sulfur subunit
MEINRRDVVIKSAATAVAVAAAACAGGVGWPGVGEARGGTDTGAPATGVVDAGDVSEFARAGINDKLAKTDRIFVVRQGDRLIATSAVCTHRNCVIRPAGGGGRSGDAELRCPCHGSRFAADGSVTRGPAGAPLPHYGISVRGGHVFVDKSKTFEKEQWGSEGSFVKV